MDSNSRIEDLISRRRSDLGRADSLLRQESDKSQAPDVMDRTSGLEIRETIMVVDDDTSQILSIKKLLKNDYNMIPCHNGKTALDQYQKYKQQIKAILLDIRLPDMEGFEVFKKLKEINPAVPIIFITGYQSTYGDGFEIYKKYRPHGYIVKNHSNETAMIKDSLAAAVESYKQILDIEKSKTLEVRNRTMAGLLHDLKNMFAPIMMMPDLLQRFSAEGDQSKLQDLYIKLKNLTQFYHANQLILFNFAKGEHYKPDVRSYPLQAMLNEFIEMIQVQFESRLDIQINFETAGTIVTDKNVLCSQVILNILKNSREAYASKSMHNGECRINVLPYSIYSQKYADFDQRIMNQKPHDLIFVFEDDAGGIPAELEKTLFEPYESFGKKNGSGLGTQMIKIGVEDYLRGQLVIQNKIGYGLSYHICIPQP